MHRSIIPFTIGQYHEVFALWQRTEGVGLSDADSKESIHRYLERNPGMSFVACTTSGKVIGAILAGHDGRRGYIHHLSIHNDFRRQGIASQLVSTCRQELQKIGIQKCHIFIYNYNASGIEFWKSVGWIHRSDLSIMSKES